MLSFLFFINVILAQKANVDSLILFPSETIKVVKIFSIKRVYGVPKNEISFSFTPYIELSENSLSKAYYFSVDYLDKYNLKYELNYSTKDIFNLKLHYLFFFTDRAVNNRNIAFLFGGGWQINKLSYLYPSFGFRFSSRALERYTGINFDVKYEPFIKGGNDYRILFGLGIFFKT